MTAEWLLKNHESHTGMLRVLITRKAQLLEALHAQDDTVSALSLPPPDEACGTQGTTCGSKVEWVALHYAEHMGHEKQELCAAIHQLDIKIQAYQQYINLYDAMLVGLLPAERWLVEAHFEQRKSLDSLVPQSIEMGLFTSRAGLSLMKKRVLGKLDALLEAALIGQDGWRQSQRGAQQVQA